MPFNIIEGGMDPPVVKMSSCITTICVKEPVLLEVNIWERPVSEIDICWQMISSKKCKTNLNEGAVSRSYQAKTLLVKRGIEGSRTTVPSMSDNYSLSMCLSSVWCTNDSWNSDMHFWIVVRRIVAIVRFLHHIWKWSNSYDSFDSNIATGGSNVLKDRVYSRFLSLCWRCFELRIWTIHI